MGPPARMPGLVAGLHAGYDWGCRAAADDPIGLGEQMGCMSVAGAAGGGGGGRRGGEVVSVQAPALGALPATRPRACLCTGAPPVRSRPRWRRGAGVSRPACGQPRSPLAAGTGAAACGLPDGDKAESRVPAMYALLLWWPRRRRAARRCARMCQPGGSREGTDNSSGRAATAGCCWPCELSARGPEAPGRICPPRAVTPSCCTPRPPCTEHRGVPALFCWPWQRPRQRRPCRWPRRRRHRHRRRHLPDSSPCVWPRAGSPWPIVPSATRRWPASTDMRLSFGACWQQTWTRPWRRTAPRATSSGGWRCGE